MNIQKILNLSTINVSKLLKTCGISPGKWADVKRGRSSFTPDEIEKIENRIKELSLMPNGMATQFFAFISQPEINISKLLKEQGIDKKTCLALYTVNKKLPDLMIAMMEWQEEVNPGRGEILREMVTVDENYINELKDIKRKEKKEEEIKCPDCGETYTVESHPELPIIVMLPCGHHEVNV